MTNIEKLKHAYPNRLITVVSRLDIPKDKHLVYILIWGDQALVVGEGKENRARVITDNVNSITPGHKKAIKVRLYHLFGDPQCTFVRFYIACDSKKEAQGIEKEIHGLIGGNSSSIDSVILEKLFKGFQENSLEWIFLKLAICSSFDGLSDLKMWRREHIIADDIWKKLSSRLKLNYMMPSMTANPISGTDSEPLKNN